MGESQTTEANASSNKLPHLPRPVFLSFARRDFRIAYEVWQQMLGPDPEQSHADQVLLDFPPLLPIGLKLHGIQMNVSSADHPASIGQGYADDWEPGQPGWMYAIRQNIEKAQSYVVVLTPYSSRSKAVALEIEAFEAYPDKPVAILSVNKTPIPETLAKIERAMVHDVTVDIRSMMGAVLKAAFAAHDNEEWWESAVAFLEAWNLLALFDDPSQALCLDILRGRGRADIQLGNRNQAVRSFEHALTLIRPEQHALRANALHSLGWAQATQDKSEIGRARESLVAATVSWRAAVAELDLVDADASVGADAADATDVTELKRRCQDALARVEPLLETDVRPQISETIQRALQAEQRQDWSAMAGHYAAMFSMYRAGGDCASQVATDMLSAKARAERQQHNWDEAGKTLKFALTFIDQDDAASRAGLTHDLGCVHARRAPDADDASVPWDSLLAAGRCWDEALALVNELLARDEPQPRFDYRLLAQSCERYTGWARAELARRQAEEKEAAAKGK